LMMMMLAAAAVAAFAAGENIVQIAESDRNLTLLVAALQAGGLVSTLEGAGPFTVFAPLNEAFMKTGPALDYLLNPHNKDALDRVLLNHVASGAVYAKDLHNGEVIPTLDSGSNVTVHIDGAHVMIDNANVVQADISASNGVIHIVDGVLVPGNSGLPAKNIVELAAATPSLSTLVTAVKAALPIIPKTLSDAFPLTVFAPTNDAFNALPAGLLEKLLHDPKALSEVLSYHVVHGKAAIYSEEIPAGRNTLHTLDDGATIEVVRNGDEVTVNDAKVVLANADAINGVVHVIDHVLIPPSMQKTSLRGA